MHSHDPIVINYFDAILTDALTHKTHFLELLHSNHMPPDSAISQFRLSLIPLQRYDPFITLDPDLLNLCLKYLLCHYSPYQKANIDLIEKIDDMYTIILQYMLIQMSPSWCRPLIKDKYNSIFQDTIIQELRDYIIDHNLNQLEIKTVNHCCIS